MRPATPVEIGVISVRPDISLTGAGFLTATGPVRSAVAIIANCMGKILAFVVVLIAANDLFAGACNARYFDCSPIHAPTTAAVERPATAAPGILYESAEL